MLSLIMIVYCFITVQIVACWTCKWCHSSDYSPLLRRYVYPWQTYWVWKQKCWPSLLGAPHTCCGGTVHGALWMKMPQVPLKEGKCSVSMGLLVPFVSAAFYHNPAFSVFLAGYSNLIFACFHLSLCALKKCFLPLCHDKFFFKFTLYSSIGFWL